VTLAFKAVTAKATLAIRALNLQKKFSFSKVVSLLSYIKNSQVRVIFFPYDKKHIVFVKIDGQCTVTRLANLLYNMLVTTLYIPGPRGSKKMGSFGGPNL